ncbi:MAG TPA: GNAT family N-acetyltransferase [Candidatus Binataceae bacterium]|nr:GNAT family N-acetyltransferase [Candidatus Binataceae bacterium]
MDVKVRPGKIDDAPALGRICYEAFRAIATEHNFSPDFPDAETAIGILSAMLENEHSYGVVAELGGRIAGSNFLYESNLISGVGPISVDPETQNHGIGRRLMLAVVQRSEQRGFAGIRLVQAGYHCRSLSLYTKLGFDPREHLSCMQGPALKEVIPGCLVRSATQNDVEICNRLCIRVHGHHRGGELRDAVKRGTAIVVERAGRIAGYATQIAFFAHAAAETNDDLKALICAAESFAGPGFLVPSRNGELMRWCLAKGLRVTQPMTLMTMGLYNEPGGAYLPSILY